jgi:spermidine synthase
MSTHNKQVFRQTQNGQVIEVWERDGLRWLTFGDDTIQTTIDLNNPEQLPSASCQALLSALMFIPTPHHVLLLGTGGGSIARYLYRRCPTIMGDAIEQSSSVAEVAKEYFEFPNDPEKWQLKVTDARTYISNPGHKYDLAILDISEGGNYTPHWITSQQFLSECRQNLSPGGALAINLIPEGKEAFMTALWNIRQSFDRKTICLSVPDHKNIVVIAFHGIPEFHVIDALEQRTTELKMRWNLEYDEFLERMIRENPAGSGIF